MKLFRLLSIIIVIALVISGCSNQPVATQPQPSAVPNQSAQTPAPKPEKILGTPAGTVMTPQYVDHHRPGLPISGDGRLVE